MKLMKEYRYQYKCTYTLNKDLYKKNAAFPGRKLKPQDRINDMPDIEDNPISTFQRSKYTIRRAEDVQAEHKMHMNELFKQLRKTHSQTR